MLVREQGLDRPERLRVLINKNVDDICNFMRKQGSKNANGMLDRGQQVSVIAQENLKLAAFLFHHRWRCTLDWEIMGVDKSTVRLMADQKKLKDEHKYPGMLPKVNKSDGSDDGGHRRIPQIMLQCHMGISSIHNQEDHNSTGL